MITKTCSGVRFRWLALFWLLASLALPLSAQAGEHPVAKPGKNAILLVTFGTSVEPAAKVFAKIEAATRARFPGVEVRWAFTAKKIRQKLAARGQITLSPAQALANLTEDGFDRVVMQSLHIIPGEEFEGLRDIASRWEGMPKGLKQVELGLPLLDSGQDRLRTAKAMLAHVPKERVPGEALVFMGHGSPHPANAIYGTMADLLQNMDPNAFLATKEGTPEFESVQRELIAKGVKKAWLIPLMSVAGDHAHNDMAGKEADSWASMLGKAGIASQPVMRGMAEYPEIVDIWMDHLQVALAKVEREAAQAAAKPGETDKGWGVELTLPMYSKYLSRGALAIDDPVMQPGATLSGYGFTFNVWGNYNLTDKVGRKDKFTEVDLTGEYAFELGNFSIPVGVVHYLYPNMTQPNTTEVYAGLSYKALITPSLKIFQDVGDVHGQLAAFTLGYNQEVWRPRHKAVVNLAITAGLDWGSSDYNKYRYNWGVDGDRLIDTSLVVGLPCKLIDAVTITPSYTHVWLMDSAIKEAAGYDSKGFWGLNLTLAF
ncbi:MAG: sirohydrochlorin cobaltochelatase [Desulfarculus sp.]|nr:sirohydrochlorin cobaltochelatase [Desulfarculus sp.]